jgi:thiol-disulfide isomerase/thioredoxin
VIPTELFNAFSINVSNNTFFFEWIFPDRDQSNIEINIYKFDRIYTYVNAGLRQDHWQEALEELTNYFHNFLARLNSVHHSFSQNERSKLESEIFDAFKFHFEIDEVIGYSLLANYINSLRMIDASEMLLSRLHELAKSPTESALLSENYVVDIVKKIEEFFTDITSLPIHDFSLITSSFDTINTSEYRGNYLLLDFWASWCSPCIKQNKIISSNIDEFELRGIKILGVFTDHFKAPYSVEKVNSSRKSLEMFPWQQGLLFKDEMTEKILKFYQVHSLPRTFLVSPHGVILAVNPKSVEDILSLFDDMENK